MGLLIGVLWLLTFSRELRRCPAVAARFCCSTGGHALCRSGIPQRLNSQQSLSSARFRGSQLHPWVEESLSIILQRGMPSRQKCILRYIMLHLGCRTSAYGLEPSVTSSVRALPAGTLSPALNSKICLGPRNILLFQLNLDVAKGRFTRPLCCLYRKPFL